MPNDSWRAGFDRDMGDAQRVLVFYGADMPGPEGKGTYRADRGSIQYVGWSLGDLRRCNFERQLEWCPDQKPDLSFRGVELAGEVGEALNIIKKLERERLGWRGSRATVEQLAKELADIVICVDLVAGDLDIDLTAEIEAKFNGTSEANGLSTRLRRVPTHRHKKRGSSYVVLGEGLMQTDRWTY